MIKIIDTLTAATLAILLFGIAFAAGAQLAHFIR